MGRRRFICGLAVALWCTVGLSESGSFSSHDSPPQATRPATPDRAPQSVPPQGANDRVQGGPMDRTAQMQKFDQLRPALEYFARFMQLRFFNIPQVMVTNENWNGQGVRVLNVPTELSAQQTYFQLAALYRQLMMPQGTVPVTDRDFSTSVLRTPGVTLVDVGAKWCGACKTLAPVYEQVAKLYAGRARLLKMDSDTNRAPSAYNVRSLPTILVFKDGKLVNRVVGAQSRERLQALIQQYL